MKTIRFAAFLIYRKARNDMQYFSTLCAVTFLIYLHLFLVLDLTNIDAIITPNNVADKWKYYIPTLILGIPIFFFLNFTIKENDLKELGYSVQKIRRGNIIIIIDFITVFVY
ncbi:MAG: hypothetical protein ABJB05_06870 [Parafilimonas sp.]